MKTFSVTTQINSKPEVIWRILTDAPKYASWNTTVDKVGIPRHVDQHSEVMSITIPR